MTNIGLSAGKFRPDVLAVSVPVNDFFTEPINSQAPYAPQTKSFFRRFIVVDAESNACSESTAAEIGIAPNCSRTQQIHEHSGSSAKQQSDSPTQPKRAFFSQFLSQREGPDDLEVETMVCSECGARVPIQLMPEHLDFHVAARIQQEWNREDQSRADVARRPATQLSSGASTRRDRKRDGVRVKIASKSNPTLDRFIAQGNWDESMLLFLHGCAK